LKQMAETRTASITGAVCGVRFGDGKIGCRRNAEAFAADRYGCSNQAWELWTTRRCWIWCTKKISRAEVDMNVVMTGSGDFVEIQAAAEGRPFTGSEMQDLLALAAAGIRAGFRKCSGRFLPAKFFWRRRAITRIFPNENGFSEKTVFSNRQIRERYGNFSAIRGGSSFRRSNWRAAAGIFPSSLFFPEDAPTVCGERGGQKRCTPRSNFG